MAYTNLNRHQATEKARSETLTDISSLRVHKYSCSLSLIPVNIKASTLIRGSYLKQLLQTCMTPVDVNICLCTWHNCYRGYRIIWPDIPMAVMFNILPALRHLCLLIFINTQIAQRSEGGVATLLITPHGCCINLSARCIAVAPQTALTAVPPGIKSKMSIYFPKIFLFVSFNIQRVLFVLFLIISLHFYFHNYVGDRAAFLYASFMF